MITAWRIENFKSYSGSHDIPLSWINVVAGANSSGKSTLIQSILALKQTLQFGPPDKSLLLNGPLVRLGSFSDVVTSGLEEKKISIGFDCNFSKEEASSLKKETEMNSIIFFGSSNKDDYVQSVSLNSIWTPSQATDELTANQAILTPNLQSTYFGVTRSSSVLQTVALTERTSNSGPGRYDVSLDLVSKNEVFDGKPEAEVVGAYADQFLPRYIAVKFNSSAKRANDIASYIFAGSFHFGSSSSYDEIALPKSVIDSVIPWLETNKISTAGINVNDLKVKTLKDAVKTEVDKSNFYPMIDIGLGVKRDTTVEKAQIANLSNTVAAILASEFPPEYIVEPVSSSNIREGAALTTALFKNAVKYLGPLRNPPRPVYQLEVVPNSTDVGFRGEHTAAVLDLNRSRRVSYVSPPSDNLENDYFSVARKKVATLHDAVVDWLSYLGVAENVETQDEGVFGNRLKVQTASGSSLHDLTNVGVGVSQVLPIVVMALLAPKSSLIVLEQPELHLHPKVQARLADFFIALSVDGKQTLSETHSEYLIDRLRLRVALSENDALLDSINIMFSQKNQIGTNLTAIELSEYGSVIEWPEDFFDQSHNDVGKILKAASEKRKRKANKNA